MEKIKNLFSKKDKRLRIFFVFGLLGIILIGISQMWPSSSSNDMEETIRCEEETEEYKRSLEEKITTLLSSAYGVGKTQVMVTLESGVEYIYEKEQELSSSLGEDSTKDSGSKLQQSSDSRETVILVEDVNGRKTALVRKKLEPKIQGVVVICEGGGRASTVETVCNLVTTACGIGYDQVCVIKSSGQT